MLKRINRIILGGHIDHVVSTKAWNIDVMGIERLGIHETVNILGEQILQSRYVRHRECGFIREPARSCRSEMLGQVVEAGWTR